MNRNDNFFGFSSSALNTTIKYNNIDNYNITCAEL